jgi:putative cardiolipin synthase
MITARNFRFLKLSLYVLPVFALIACSTIPLNYPRTETHAYAYKDTRQTVLGRQLAGDLRAHPGQSAFLPLVEGTDALAARLGLAQSAEKSLDIQYYIWRGDTTGMAVAYTLLQAADRGVRVRLLLDDLQASVHDPALLALDQHPHIQVRMFNPSAARYFKGFELMSRFDKLNRRMHNKSFIADNQMAIVGGRNIGDEYFNANPEVDFSDFDVLAIGPVVPEISATFDLYWNSELAVPISVLYDDEEKEFTLAELSQAFNASWQKTLTSEYARAVRESQFVRDIHSNKTTYYWGEAKAVADAPEKFLHDSTDKTTHMGPQLHPLLKNIKSELFIISPYFIPGDDLVRYFSDLVKQGVHVTILTNSFASNDVGIVHAGYAKYREALLEAGVELYEYKPDPTRIKRKTKGSGMPGSSRASLHAKVFVIDRKQLFVGSMNLDPRSLNLNSELGVIIDSPRFARNFVEQVSHGFTENAYHLRLVNETDEEGNVIGKTLHWETTENGKTVTYDSEPHVGFFRKLGIWVMSLFVSEELL